ncbi:MAG: hypothetical protein EOO99_00500 [Pedobacter sp.]|jgi:ABC-type polysaccharide/polyol phosphate export permease|nr:MAG: hypothetical protein EOO99_00500 [Pedobacter sp.]
MSRIKRFLGFVWIILGPLGTIFMLYQAFDKISQAEPSHQLNTALQWGIILLVFIPIAIGLMIFGKYAIQDEYK